MDERRFDLGTVTPVTSIASLMGRLPDGYAAREEYERGLQELAELRAEKATADKMQLSEYVVFPKADGGSQMVRRCDVVAATGIKRAVVGSREIGFAICTIKARSPNGETYSFDAKLSMREVLALLDGKPVVPEAPKFITGTAIPANTSTGEWIRPEEISTAAQALKWIEEDCVKVVRRAGMGEELPSVEDLARRYVRAVKPWKSKPKETDPSLMEPARSAINRIWSDANGQLLGRAGGWMPTPPQFALSIGATARKGTRDEREWEPIREEGT